MLRVHEVRVPLDHGEDTPEAAIVRRISATRPPAGRVPAAPGGAGVRAGRPQLQRAGAARRRLPRRAALDRPGQRQPCDLPGVTWTDLNDSWPDYVIAALREALPAFDPIIKVYVRTDAVLTGVEVRTSSPVHLRRDHAYQSVNTTGLCLARVTPAASYRRR